MTTLPHKKVEELTREKYRLHGEVIVQEGRASKYEALMREAELKLKAAKKRLEEIDNEIENIITDLER